MGKLWGMILAGLAVLGAIVLLLHQFWVSWQGKVFLQTYSRQPIGVMGTECRIKTIAPGSQRAACERALADAEAALRDVDAHMSVYLVASELSRFNAAPAGKLVELSPRTLELLKLSRDLAETTGGAFDVTSRPIIELWKRAGKAGRLPSETELADAKRRTGWKHIELLKKGARKRIDGAGIDLGGIAKGYGIDRAAKAMGDVGLTNGLIDVGGDVRGFGDRVWRISVRSPFDGTFIARLKLCYASVCTSGNYQRFVEIDGKRYSHVVDPRTGYPAEMTPSVTVVAPRAVLADAWATALSVLGVEGLKLIPPGSGIEAMIVVGTPEDHRLHVTSGFEKFFAERPKAPVMVYRRPKSQGTAKKAA